MSEHHGNAQGDAGADSPGGSEPAGGATEKPVFGEGAGKLIELSLEPLDSTDLGLVRAWRNDYSVWKWCRQSGVISDAEQVQWFNGLAGDQTRRMFKIAVKVDGKVMPAGVCGLTSIDYQHSRAEFSLYVAPSLQKMGIGRGALSMLLLHGFANLGLNLIWGETFDGNPAIRMFEALGFKKEGTRRAFYWKGGRRVDAHLYSITRDEWTSLCSQ